MTCIYCAAPRLEATPLLLFVAEEVTCHPDVASVLTEDIRINEAQHLFRSGSADARTAACRVTVRCRDGVECIMLCRRRAKVVCRRREESAEHAAVLCCWRKRGPVDLLPSCRVGYSVRSRGMSPGCRQGRASSM